MAVRQRAEAPGRCPFRGDILNQTNNYQLSQWDSDDRILRTDFNADNAKVDAALADQAAAIAEQAAQLSGFGNCWIYYTTYVGAGTYGAGKQTIITFPKRPLLVVVADGNGASVLAIRGMSTGYRREHGTTYVNLGWGVNTLSLSQPDSSEAQMNKAGVTYHVIGLLAEDQ